MEPNLDVAMPQSKILRSQFTVEKRTAFIVMSVWASFALCCPVPDALAAPTVDQILNELPDLKREKPRIMKGDIVQWTSENCTERQVLLGMAMLVRQKPKDLAQLFREAAVFKIIEQVKGHGEIKGKGTMADFAGVVLEPNGDREATRARVGRHG